MGRALAQRRAFIISRGGSVDQPQGEPKRKQVRAAIYVRVSTEEQAQSGYSIPAQIEKLQSLAKSLDWELLPSYVDDGYSGKDLERPAVKRLLEDGRKKRFDLIILYKLDRLSRRLSDLVSLGELFERIGIGLRSLTEPFDTTNPAGKLLFNMLGSFAQFERELIGERTRLAMRRRMREGKWNGLAPFGYRLGKEGKLEIADGDAPYVRRVFELLIEHNLGIKMISRRMNADDQASRRKGKWTSTSSWQMLTNPAYTGCMIVEGKIMPGTHPPIISDEQFNWAQELLKARTVVPGRLGQSPNFLIGLVRCGKCGRLMTTMKGTGHLGEKYYYYACSARRREGACDMRYVRARHLEEAVLREIRTISGEPKIIEEYLAQHLAENQTVSKGLLAERVSVQKQLEGAIKTKEERVRWLVDNIPAKAVADAVSVEIQAQIDSIGGLQRRLTEIDGRLTSIASDNAKSDNLAGLLGDFATHFDTWNQGKKRSLIQNMVHDIKVTAEGDVEVTFAIPLTTHLVDQMRAKIEAPPDEKPFTSVPLELIGGSHLGSPLCSKALRA